jgi:uncharacterized OB-fold protein
VSDYFRAIDPLPLQSADQNKLHGFYAALGEGRLVTTRCAQCGRLAWPPRGFCGECTCDRFDWAELPREGVVHGCTRQETGVPAGFTAPLVFAIVKVGELRIFAPVVGPGAADVQVGSRVTLEPLRAADEPGGGARHLVAFRPAAA